MTLPTALPSSTGTRHRMHTVLTDQYSLGMRSNSCSNTHLLLKLLLIYGSVFVSSSLRLPPSVHVNLPWGNLSPLPPRLLPCSGLLSSRYCAGGGTNLVQYTVNRLLQQTLLHKPLPFYGFVFVFPSYSSYSSSPSFLFCSLAGFHLECTSNSLGATSLWPAGLPKAVKSCWLSYIYICIYIYAISIHNDQDIIG